MSHLTIEYIYAGISGLGLLIAVYAMLNGSVKIKQNPADMVPPPAAFNTPVLGTAVLAFGVVGYLTTRYATESTPLVNIIAAFVAAGVAWAGMTTLMAKWALKGSLVDPHEELEELQGTVATVIREITPTELGTIEYPFRGEIVRIAARNIDGTGVTVGTEVVIEKIENDVADVELWELVEKRL